MFNNIIKLAVIVVIMTATNLSFATKPQTTHDTSIQSTASVMMLAKGQYYNDSRNYKPATC